jgi:hypothetical protein
MSIPYTLKVNERLTASPITGEVHVVGIIGVATYAPGKIRLIEVPQESILTPVVIPGYTEILTGSPSNSQFLVNYSTGAITFNVSQDGVTVSVSYAGLGSEIAAEDINELQEPLNSIVQLSLTYNWPSAPTVSWSLASGLAVTTINGLFDNVTLVPGANVTITPAGNSLIIDSTGGSGSFSTRTVSASTTPLPTDGTLLVDASGGVVTITLPIASTMVDKIYEIKKIDSSLNGVTIAGAGGNTIDGSATFLLDLQYEALTVQSNGTNWFIL